MECNGCGLDKPIVLSSGYRLCNDCAVKSEGSIIRKMVLDGFPKFKETRVHEILTDMFGTVQYGFPLFSKLYDRWPRGAWIEKDGKFEIPQVAYIRQCFLDYERRLQIV